MNARLRRVLLSRTDSIGDVVLTLPMAGYLKTYCAVEEVFFLGNAYTEKVIAACPFVDKVFKNDDVLGSEVWDVDAVVHVFPRAEIAWQAKRGHVPLRVGTSRRWYHWLTCNTRVPMTRKHSDLHEAQLNMRLLAPFGIKPVDLAKLLPFSELKAVAFEHPEVRLDPRRFKLILHPLSKGSARNWPLDDFYELACQLDPARFQIFVTGSPSEREILRGSKLLRVSGVEDISGKLTLAQLLSFIGACDGLVAASTGPLHLAASLGIHALGLYCLSRPVHPGRWAPLGRNAEVITAKAMCVACSGNGGEVAAGCTCMAGIKAETVAARVKAWQKG